MIAQVRLGAECLWRLTPRRALDDLDTLVKRLWGRTPGQWQVSQAHLAVDVVNAPITDDGLARYVSRSRKQAVYAAARKEMDQLLHDLRDNHGSLDDDVFFVDWDADFADDDLDAMDGLAGGWGDPFADDDGFGGVPRVSRATVRAQADLDTSLDDRRVTTYKLGRRYSGASWLVGGAISFVLYDKTLQVRLTNRRYMDPIWAAAGRQPDERVTRHEGRLRREVFRELRLPGKVMPCLDDPWQFLDHLPDLWALLVGQPEEDCPDAVNVAWIRQVVPSEEDSNRSRWPTDPAWCVGQRATFTSAPAQTRQLIRRKQQAADGQVLVKLNYGTLVSWTARLHTHGGQYDVSAALGEIVPALMREAAKPDKDFGALVRERRRQWGLTIPVHDRVLPFHPRPGTSSPYEGRPEVSSVHEPPLAAEALAPSVDAAISAGHPLSVQETIEVPEVATTSDAPPLYAGKRECADRLRLLEHQLRDTLRNLELASAQGRPKSEQRRWEQAYELEMQAYDRLAQTEPGQETL